MQNYYGKLSELVSYGYGYGYGYGDGYGDGYGYGDGKLATWEAAGAELSNEKEKK